MTLPDFTEEQKRFIQTAKDVGLWGQVCSDSGAVRFGEALNQYRIIESAPKDEYIMAFHIFHKCWISGYIPSEGKYKWNFVEKTITHVWPITSFSHFMPLPTAPK